MIVWAGKRTGSSRFMQWLYKEDTKHRDLPYGYNLLDTAPIPFSNLEVFNPDHGAYRNNNDLETILKQDFVMKIHPEWVKEPGEEFILNVIKYSGDHEHLIVYRENPYDRLLSCHYAEMNKNHGPDIREDNLNFPIDVNGRINIENKLRARYKLIYDNTNCKTISYEDIHHRKDYEKLKQIFPHFNIDSLLETKRYPHSKKYEHMPNANELKTRCLELGDFKLGS